MSQPSILETERLILRSFNMSDAREVQRLAGEKDIASTSNVPHPYEDGMAEEWISTHQQTFEEGKRAVFAITSKTDGMLIGAISLMAIEQGHKAELGFWIGKPYWNNGYCTEAGEAVLRYAFEKLGLNRVHAGYLSRNPASGRVLEKLGMSHEGTLRKNVLKWGIFEDYEIWGILKSECIRR